MCNGQAHCILLPDFIFENRFDQNVPSIFTSFFIYLYRINFSHIPFKFFTNEYFHKYSFVRLTYISLISLIVNFVNTSQFFMNTDGRLKKYL